MNESAHIQSKFLDLNDDKKGLIDQKIKVLFLGDGKSF